MDQSRLPLATFSAKPSTLRLIAAVGTESGGRGVSRRIWVLLSDLTRAVPCRSFPASHNEQDHQNDDRYHSDHNGDGDDRELSGSRCLSNPLIIVTVATALCPLALTA